MNVVSIVARDSEYWNLRNVLEGVDPSQDGWKRALRRGLELARQPGAVGEAMRRAIEQKIGIAITLADILPVEPEAPVEQNNTPDIVHYLLKRN